MLKTLGTMPRLKRLNLSRNKIVRLASDLFKGNTDFLELQEIDVSFNWLDDEKNLWFLTQTRGVNLVIITGNPFASRASKTSGLNDYEALENELSKNLSAVIINDVGLVDDQGFYLKRKAGQ
jgi:Leucine-rich repeat (LRR) protein